ncbi:MAG: DUF2878 domain-containing protein [Oceanococcus sp.]
MAAPIVETGIPRIVQILAFQLLWLILVVSAVRGGEIFAIGCMLLWVCIHLRYSLRAKQDIQLLLLACALGPIADTVLINTQLISYSGFAPLSFLPPLWVFALWANFALLLHNNMAMLRNHPYLLATMAVISAPIAYWSGAKLGAASLASPNWQPLCVVALSWGIILPVLAVLSSKLHASHSAASVQTST